jgi:CrcB protein
MRDARPIESVETIILVGIGGFAGANLRYFVAQVLPSSLLATATVNILGCVALGFILYEEMFSGNISQPSRTMLTVGFIASFTTYSTFIVDIIQTQPMMALFYTIGSYALGFCAVLMGREAARWVTVATPAQTEVHK